MNRERFPGLNDGWIRLDGPGGSQVLDRAAAAVSGYLTSSGVANVHGHFPASVTTSESIVRARTSVANLMGTQPRNVAFGPSTTTLAYRFAQAVATTLEPGDEIVCTVLDHDANVSPWLDIAARTGARVLFAQPEPGTLNLPVESYASIISTRTKWIATTAASNVVGTMPDLQLVSKLARVAGARVFVDAVHIVPHGPIDVREWGCDVAVTSGYKWFGPHLAALFVSDEVLETVQPQRLRPVCARGVPAWEQGALPVELLAGLAEAADYLSEIGTEKIETHENRLLHRLVEGLAKISKVRTYGAPSRRTPTVTFDVEGWDPHELAAAFARHKIAVWSGHFYAVELFHHLGLKAAVRVGALHYNSVDEIDRFLDCLEALASNGRGTYR